jgi:hypothetical protein
MEPFGPLNQSRFGFGVVGIRHATIHRAYRRTLFLIEKSHAFSAFVGDNIIDIFLDGGMIAAVKFPLGAAFVNSGIGAFRFAGAAIYTFFSDYS